MKKIFVVSAALMLLFNSAFADHPGTETMGKTADQRHFQGSNSPVLGPVYSGWPMEDIDD